MYEIVMYGPSHNMDCPVQVEVPEMTGFFSHETVLSQTLMKTYLLY